MSEIDQDDAKRRQRARFVNALTNSAQQPGERPRLGTRVAGAVAVLALAAGATLGVGAWRSYQADEKKKEVELAAEQASRREALTRPPSPVPSQSTAPRATTQGTERGPGPGLSAERPASDPITTLPVTPTKKQTEEPTQKAPEAELRTLTAASRTLLLKNAYTGLCADISYYGAGKKGDAVSQYYCDGTDKDNQLWRMTAPRPGAGPGGRDLVQFANLKDGLCIDLPTRGAQPAGTGLMEAECTGTMGDNQLWWFEQVDSTSVWIRNFASNHLCLKVNGTGSEKTERAQLLVIGSCGSRDDSRWQLID
ncbi:RICIN domain-containing protein [Streptomyces parvulus]|uniref:RICIN domain-containing protein n=1 Tax=Streptomyces parvulus TaxID=146923 RepID=UPI0015F11918|nr:RICIN domain-containing protein [Streptomyces parvulus]